MADKLSEGIRLSAHRRVAHLPRGHVSVAAYTKSMNAAPQAYHSNGSERKGGNDVCFYHPPHQCVCMTRPTTAMIIRAAIAIANKEAVCIRIAHKPRNPKF
jgi:hypothetical protein